MGGFIAFWIALLLGGFLGLFRNELLNGVLGGLYVGFGVLAFWAIAVKKLNDTASIQKGSN
jgi:hypothetical protein